MVYEYKYRDASGSLITKYVEARDRAEAFREIKTHVQKIVSISEFSKNVGGKANSKENKGRAKVLIIVSSSILLILFFAFIAYICIQPKSVLDVTKEKKAKSSNTSQLIKKHKEHSNLATTNSDTVVSVSPSVNVPASVISVTNPSTSVQSQWANKPMRIIKRNEAEVPKRFKYNSENLIADMLEIEPGESLIGEIPFGKRFIADFKKSLSEKIEILDSDSDYDRKVKQAVIETKAELKARMDAGEDIGQIMQDARKELQETGIYRDQLIQELHDIRRSGDWTADEYEKFVAAANAMLANKGAKPIVVPKVLIRKLRLQDEKRKAVAK